MNQPFLLGPANRKLELNKEKYHEKTDSPTGFYTY